MPDEFPAKAGEQWGDISTRLARVVQYKHGARVEFLSLRDGRSHEDAERGDIKDQSAKSRRRVAFALGNAECTWLAMLVLTWRDAPTLPDVKRALRKLRRLWRERWGESMDAWLMEMQERGVPHFHIFIAAESNFGKACADAPKVPTLRKGKVRDLVRGAPEKWIVGAWLSCTRDRSAEALAFNRGGIIEMFYGGPDAAGRYAAKECSKRQQKILPPEYSEGLGRWWWLNPLWEPIARRSYWADLAQWPWESPMSRIWNSADVSHLAPVTMNKATMRELFFRECSDRGYTP